MSRKAGILRGSGRRRAQGKECPEWGDWRRGWDSNPRYGLSPYNGLANRRLQPLGHPSGGAPPSTQAQEPLSIGPAMLQPGVDGPGTARDAPLGDQAKVGPPRALERAAAKVDRIPMRRLVAEPKRETETFAPIRRHSRRSGWDRSDRLRRRPAQWIRASRSLHPLDPRGLGQSATGSVSAPFARRARARHRMPRSPRRSGRRARAVILRRHRDRRRVGGTDRRSAPGRSERRTAPRPSGCSGR